MSELPDGWEWVTADQITAPERNALAIGPFGSDLKVSDYLTEGVPLVFVRNIRANAFDLPDIRFVSQEKAESLRAHQVRNGDLLITKMGDPPGDAAIYRLEEPGIITADCIKLTPHPSIDVRYLLYAIMSPQVQHQIGEITQGVAQRKVSLDRFRKRIVLPLAPPAQQKRIVTAIEEQFSRLGAGVAALEQSIQRVALFRGTLIESLIMGDGESVPLGEVIQVQSGFAFSSKDWTVSGVPVVKIANVRGGALDLTTCSHVTASTAAKAPGCHLLDNDVLVTLTGNVGAVAMVRHEGPLVLNQRVGRARIINPQRMVPHYLFYTLQARTVHAQIQRMSYGSNQANVSPSRIHEIRVCVPPVDQQERVVQELENSLGILSQIESLLRSQLIRANRLRSSILSTAFSGKLVPQNPNDESASSLLEKIAIERSAPEIHKDTKRKPRVLRK